MKPTVVSWIALVIALVALAVSITQFISSAGTAARMPLMTQDSGGSGGSAGNCTVYRENGAVFNYIQGISQAACSGYTTACVNQTGEICTNQFRT